MPIDFPPPPTPQQEDLSRLRAEAAAGVVSVDIGIYVLRVMAPGIFSESEIREVTAGFLDLSQAIRALNAAAQNKSAAIPRTLYARDGDAVYVSISAGSLAAVEGPQRLKPYFEDLVGDTPLALPDFERRRLLAGTHATRSGQTLTPTFAPVEGAAYRMILKPGDEPVASGAARVNFTNFGNRFTGREFIDFDARQGSPWGDEWAAQVRTGAKITGIDDVEPGNEYNELFLGWNRVTPLGFFGVSGRMTDYRQQFDAVALTGEIKTFDMGYTRVVHASATRRLIVQARADYVEKRLKFAASGVLEQLEPYSSLEFGGIWAASFRLFGQGFLSQSGLTLRHGLGADGASRTTTELDYKLLRPAFSLRTLGDGFGAELQVSGQLANESVPEQQQWVVGGAGNLHAYVPGIAIGDRGALLRLVGEAPPFAMPGVSLKSRLFLEWGLARYSEATARQPAATQSVSDAGGELLFGFGRFFEASLSAALPLHDSGIDRRTRDDARADFLFRFSGKF